VTIEQAAKAVAHKWCKDLVRLPDNLPPITHDFITPGTGRLASCAAVMVFDESVKGVKSVDLPESQWVAMMRYSFVRVVTVNLICSWPELTGFLTVTGVSPHTKVVDGVLTCSIPIAEFNRI